MNYHKVTYVELFAYAHQLGVRVIPWENCHPSNHIGGGVSMSVYSGTCLVDGAELPAAFKFAKMVLTETTRERTRHNTLRDIRQEVRMMGRIKGHPYVVQLLGVSFNNLNPILIVELASDNLENYLASNKANWSTKIRLTTEIVVGLEAIHDVNIIHGDLKAENILVFENGDGVVNAKISDFGFSSTMISIQDGNLPGYTGLFRPPECFELDLVEWAGRRPRDLYSYGLVAWQIATDGNVPFEDMAIDEIDDIKTTDRVFDFLLNLLPEDTPIEIRNVICRTVKRLPWERATVEEVRDTLIRSSVWEELLSYEEVKEAFKVVAEDTRVEKPSIKVFTLHKMPIPVSIQKKVFEEFQRDANLGDATAQDLLGVCFRFGYGTEVDTSKSFEWHLKSAEAGHTDGMNSVGLCYRRGDGVEKDPIKAVEYFRASAAAGNIYALSNLASSYLGGYGVEKDPVEAVRLLHIVISKSENSFSLNKLGLCYQQGEGVEKDPIKGFELISRSAKEGNSFGQNSLGMCYEQGMGVEKDLNKAAEWYEKAVALKNVFAMNNLGMCYEKGLGVDRNPTKAAEYYQMAADLDNSHAMINLASCYSKGHGVKQDNVKVFELLSKAAAKGNTSAFRDLAHCYRMGIGVEINIAKAIKLDARADAMAKKAKKAGSNDPEVHEKTIF